VIYFFVFVALLLAQSGLYFGLDRRLTPMLGRWGWLASGRLKKTTPLSSRKVSAERE
jgi:hypothetical protein